MRKQKSIKTNMCMSILLTTTNFLFPLLTYSYVARVLTPVGTGKIAFVQSVLSYFSHIAMLGIPSYGLRECARVRDDKDKLSHLVQELLILNILFTMFSYGILILTIVHVPKLYSYRDIFLVMGGSILCSTIGLEWVYQALEEYTYITTRSLAFKCVSVVLTFCLIRSERDYLWYGFILILTNSASYILNFLNIKKHIRIQKKYPYCLKRHIKPILTFFMASIVITIYGNFDVSMLGFISTEQEVGLYNSASKIKNLILSFSSAITAVLIPRIGYYMEKRKQENVDDLLTKSLRISLLLCIPITIYAIMYAEKILIFLCGNAYIEATSTMRILVICIVPLVLTNLFGNQILIPLGMEKRFSQSVFIGMWINLVLNTFLIPKYGSLGAAVGTLVTECWNVFWMSSGVSTYKRMLKSRVQLINYLIPLLFACVASHLISLCIMRVSIFCQLLLTATTYFAIYYILQIIVKEPLMMAGIRLLIRRVHH